MTKNSFKKARRDKRKAAAQAAALQANQKRELIPGIFLPQNLQLPKGSKDFLWQYYKSHPDDNWRPNTNMDIAIKAGAADRISELLSFFFVIHGTQSMLTAEIETLMDDFGLWIKGVRPAMNDVLSSEDKFFNTMRDCLDRGDDPEGAHQQYMRDFDSFYDKAMRWMRIPKQWHPGEEPKLPEITEKDRAKAIKKGKLIVDTGWEEMKITPVELPDEIKREWKTYYISKLLRDETAEVVKSNIPTLLGAKRIAMELQRNDPNETYVIYEAHNKRQDTATLEPKIAVTPHGVVDGTKLADTKAKAKNHKQEKKQKQEQANE
jgi:hypothetical protein